MGEGLEGHFCSAEFRKACARRAGLLGKKRHGADGLALGIYECNLAEGGIGVGKNSGPGDGVERDTHERRGDGVSQKWSSKTGFAGNGARAGIVYGSLEILKL